MTILSVDDNDQNRYLIEMVGQAHGYDVLSASNGSEALEKLEQQLPDLIVSDILMPEMDGFQFCHEVKCRERTRHIPFIFYTATYTAKQDAELALSMGASRFIVKPMEPVEFTAIIEEVLSEAQRGETAVPEIGHRETVKYLKAYNSRLVCKLDRKIEQLEASRRELRESLEARDREIAQRRRAEEERSRLEVQFLHAQKLESVGRLAGGIAHDFNNLLTVINAHSQFFLDDLPPTSPMRRGMEEIHTAGERAARLTKQLLALSRRKVIDARPLDLSRAVEEIQGMIQSLVGSNIEVVTKLTTTGRVVMDEGQFHQVLLNLVVNAKDAMPRGGRLTIETASVGADAVQAEEGYDAQTGPYILLSVTDNGTGMNRETMEHLFEPFFTTKGEGEGTGLGLSTVYGIVRQCGGWIQADSEPGCRSTFRIWWPEHKEIEEAPEPSPETINVPAHQTGGKETVLVVEDYASVRSIIVMILNSRGYHVLETACGADALALADRYPGAIDLLISDVQMPQMDGPELARQLRARRPNLRVLFASAHLAGAWNDVIVSGPGTSWITKPFLSEALGVKVRELLDASCEEASAAEGR